MSELKRCPFCKGEKVTVFYEEDRLYHFYCPDCDKHTYFQATSQEHAIQIFNNRADGWISVDELKNENKKLRFMIENGLGFEDIHNSIAMPPVNYIPLPEPPEVGK